MLWRHHVLFSLHWRHDELAGVSNHQPHDCLLNGLLMLIPCCNIYHDISNWLTCHYDIFTPLVKHYSTVIMSTMVSQFTSVWIVCLTVRSGADKKNIKALRHWPLCGEYTGHRWIPRTKGQWRAKCFHLMTSSWLQCTEWEGNTFRMWIFIIFAAGPGGENNLIGPLWIYYVW